MCCPPTPAAPPPPSSAYRIPFRLVKEHKGRAATPKDIDFVDAIPLTPLGKPDKKALRAAYWAGQERAVN